MIQLKNVKSWVETNLELCQVILGGLNSNPTFHVDAMMSYFTHSDIQESSLQVRQDFEELPADSVGSLCDSLLECLRLYASVSMVRTQLSLAFAALVAHVPREYWGPRGTLSWLAQRLETLPQDSSVKIMVELLIILPEVS